MPMDRQKILAGRKALEAYRTAHAKLYKKPRRKTIPEEHTPLLKAMTNALEGLGFISAQADFEAKKTEVLAKFWEDSELLNIQELGFVDKEDFDKKATDTDRQALKEMWK